MPWQAVGASVRGTGHVRAGLPCQDHHACRVLAADVALAAVADGLGSAPRSDEGARIAVEAALDSADAALHAGPPADLDGWLALVRRAAGDAREAICAAAAAAGAPPHDFAATLLLAVATPDWLAVGQVGDGAVVARRAGDGGLWTPGEPEVLEYANQVRPLTARDALAALRVTAYRVRVDRLALLSDGLQRLALAGRAHAPHPPFFGALFRALDRPLDAAAASSDLAAWLASPAVCRRTDDDKTLVLLAAIP